MMMRHHLARLCLVAFLLLAPSALFARHPSEDAKVRFDGHNLQRVYIENESQRRAVESLGFDVWSHESNVVIGENHILIPPGGDRVLSAHGVSFLGTLIDDVQKIIDKQDHDRMMKKLNGSSLGADWFDDYHVFEEIVYEVKRLANAHDFVDYVPSIGQTIQGRDIIALFIHGGPSKTLTIRSAEDIPADLPKIVFTGGQHAREWISPATVMYLIHQLIKSYGTDTEVTQFLDKVGIVIIPVSNPDGYDYAWTTNRLWRKNRRQNTGGTYGVDLNRNWDTHWGGVGSSKTPSSDTYCGTKAFSEPETQAISKFISGLGNVIAAIDWHSYSQLILRPWGWTQTPPKNNNYLTKLGVNMQSAIKSVHNKAYTNEASWELYYTTGSAADWYYEKVNITISYTIELRDTGTYGFVLPPAQIKPTGEESWAATKVFIKSAIEEIVG